MDYERRIAALRAALERCNDPSARAALEADDEAAGDEPRAAQSPKGAPEDIQRFWDRLAPRI